MENKKLLFAGILGGVVLVAAISFATVMIFRDDPQGQSQDKQAILQSIRAANPALFNHKQSSDLAAASNFATAETDSKMSAIFEPQFKYTADKSTQIAGPAASRCETIYSPAISNAVRSESYNYYDNGKFYGKSIGYSASNELINYYLSYPIENGDKGYTYFGGTYAVETDYLYDNNSTFVKVSTSEPEAMQAPPQNEMEETTTTEETIVEPDVVEEPSFIDDRNIVGEEKINGIDAYIIEYTYQTNCDFEKGMTDAVRSKNTVIDMGEEQLADTTIVERSWVSKEDYNYIQSKTYIDTVNDENLVTTYTYQSTKTNQPFSEVSDIFTFDLNVPVTKITIDNTSATLLENEKQYLRSHPVKTLKPVKIESISQFFSMVQDESSPSEATYLNDRAFYPQGEIGDELFKQYDFSKDLVMEDDWARQESDITYLIESGGITDLNITSYQKAGNSLTKIIDQHFGGNENALETTTLVIDGKKYTAKYIDQENYYGVIEPGSGGVDDPVIMEQSTSSSNRETTSVMPAEPGNEKFTENYNYINYFVETEDRIFVISATMKADSQLPDFETLDSNDVDDLTFLESLIDKTYQGMDQPVKAL